MGIRFYCPNGHKLNVKNFLAGKRGICPHCQTKVEIPLESDPRLIAADSSISSESPVGLSTTPVIPSSSDPNNDVVPADAPDAGIAAPGAHDPISAAPHAVWYVRPPSGGQFGPASADVMRTWLDEGRIPTDALVWRDGWPDWKVANQLFSGLAVTDSSVGSSRPAELPKIVTDDSGRQITGRLNRKSNSSTNFIVGLLIFACVGLFFVLLYVLRG